MKHLVLSIKSVYMSAFQNGELSLYIDVLNIKPSLKLQLDSHKTINIDPGSPNFIKSH